MVCCIRSSYLTVIDAGILFGAYLYGKCKLLIIFRLEEREVLIIESYGNIFATIHYTCLVTGRLLHRAGRGKRYHRQCRKYHDSRQKHGCDLLA